MLMLRHAAKSVHDDADHVNDLDLGRIMVGFVSESLFDHRAPERCAPVRDLPLSCTHGWAILCLVRC